MFVSLLGFKMLVKLARWRSLDQGIGTDRGRSCRLDRRSMRHFHVAIPIRAQRSRKADQRPRMIAGRVRSSSACLNADTMWDRSVVATYCDVTLDKGRPIVLARPGRLESFAAVLLSGKRLAVRHRCSSQLRRLLIDGHWAKRKTIFV